MQRELWILCGAAMLVFCLIGLLGGWLASLSLQVCPACLRAMTKGARKCPHCHELQEHAREQYRRR